MTTAPKLGISTFATLTGPETLAASDSLADELAESASEEQETSTSAKK